MVALGGVCRQSAGADAYEADVSHVPVKGEQMLEHRKSFAKSLLLDSGSERQRARVAGINARETGAYLAPVF